MTNANSITTTPATTTTVAPVKEIRFNRADKDFAYLLNGEIIGYASTYLQAEQKLNELVYQLLSRSNTDAADLTPEEAADVLDAFTQVEAEQAAADDETIVRMIPAVAELMRANAEADEAQAFLEAEEARAGVEETLPRRILIPNDAESIAVRRIIDGITFDVNPEGLFIARSSGVLIELDPLDAVALLTFIQSPNVAAIISQYEHSMQNTQWLTFMDEGDHAPDARRWRPVDELPAWPHSLELLTTEAMLQIAADAERRGVEQGTQQTVALIRKELEKKAA